MGRCCPHQRLCYYEVRDLSYYEVIEGDQGQKKSGLEIRWSRWEQSHRDIQEERSCGLTRNLNAMISH